MSDLAIERKAKEAHLIRRGLGREGHSPSTTPLPWTTTWTAAPQLTEPANLPPPPGLTNTTLRQIVRLSLGGSALRVRFSNEFGTTPLTIDAAHVALALPHDSKGAIRPEIDRALTFGGASSVVVPPGTPVVSDPIAFATEPFADVAVTLHVRDGSTTVTGHPGARCTSYLVAGDHVSEAVLAGAATTEHWYYLSGIAVQSSQATGAMRFAVAVVGDSLTDGRGSTTNGNGRWTDALARRLQADSATAHIGVLNLGLGGNRVCRDGLGPSGLSRLDRDVLAQPGVRDLILIEGINDLGTHSASAADLIAAYRQIVVRAHDRGVRVFGGTLTPCGGSQYFSPELEAARQTLNEWTRHSGVFDGVVDFDAATRDPQKPTHLRADADSGDHLHLNDAGYRLMADAVDVNLFKRNP